MYLDHFQLKVKPFQITSDPKFLWLGEKHKEALATLRYGIIDNRGFLLMTGEVGTGKTILVNQLISMMDFDTVVATLPDPDLVSMDFYQLLADGFKMKRKFSTKAEFLIQLREFLYQSHAERKQVLLIIDESQRLNHHLMEDIRVLSNIELHDRKLINIFFVGQQEFNTILAAPQNRALAQRITVQYHIEPLAMKEVGNYIEHRLKVAGTTKKLFQTAAIEEVYRFSGGIPRLINILCDHALLTCYARGGKSVDKSIILECAQELRIAVKSINKDTPASMQVPDTKSIAQATARSAASTKSSNASNKENRQKNPSLKKVEETSNPRSSAARLLYAAVVLIMVFLAGYAVTRITSERRPTWDEKDLTPQKYKTSLEREKELLAKRLEDVRAKVDQSAANGDSKNTSANKTSEQTGKTSDPKVAEAQSNSGKKVKVTHQSASSSEAPVGSIAPLPLMKEKTVIHFSINSNEIDQSSYIRLDQIAAYLVNHPQQIVYVRGYTDSSGSTGYNETVSRFRAGAVKSYLVGKGAKSDMIKVFAMGDAFPVASNDTSTGRSMNRRVEVEFYNAPDAESPF